MGKNDDADRPVDPDATIVDGTPVPEVTPAGAPPPLRGGRHEGAPQAGASAVEADAERRIVGVRERVGRAGHASGGAPPEDALSGGVPAGAPSVSTPTPVPPTPVPDPPERTTPGSGGTGGGSGSGGGDGDGAGDRPWYPAVEGVTWQPLYEEAEARAHASTWLRATGIGLLVAVVLLVVATFLASEHRLAVLGIGAAAIGGLALVAAGIAWIAGEVLRAHATRPAVQTRSLEAFTPVSEMFKTLKEGLGGLTAPRALVFAGAFLLAVTAIAGAITVAGNDGDEPETNQTEEPTGAPTVDPTE